MILKLNHVEKSFGSKKVLSDISFQVESGKAFGLLGRNGAGKTTTIRILMNVLHADSGEVLIDGKPVDYGNIRLGYLPEERGLYPKKVIIDQLAYFAELKGLDHKSAVKACDFWLEKLGMEEHRNKKLETLSKGNQQKIQMITALAHDPDIIVLDEPFSGIDPVNAMQLKNVVKEEIERGKIVLFSSHQMSYIEEFCDDIAIIKEGKIALFGNLNEIKRNYVRDKLVVSSAMTDKLEEEFNGRYEKQKNGSLIIHLGSPSEKREVMKRLAEDYDLDEIKVFEPSLNDIFVEYAGD